VIFLHLIHYKSSPLFPVFSLFQMLLMELVPGTSVVTPLIGKYLLFTCIIVSISVIASVIVLNFTQRSGATHQMSPLVRRIFLEILPKKLCMARPVEARRPDFDFSSAHSELLPFDNPYKKVSRSAKYKARYFIWSVWQMA
jgi:nicotinic acetylcholine receptor, invertebrate